MQKELVYLQRAHFFSLLFSLFRWSFEAATLSRAFAATFSARSRASEAVFPTATLSALTQASAAISYALRVLGWVLGNWDPLKGTLRLPCVYLFRSRRDNFIGIKA